MDIKTQIITEYLTQGAGYDILQFKHSRYFYIQVQWFSLNLSATLFVKNLCAKNEHKDEKCKKDKK